MYAWQCNFHRSAVQVFNGSFTPVIPRSECRCPGSQPSVSAQLTTQCVHPLLPSVVAVQRTNGKSYPPENANDDNINSVFLTELGRSNVWITVDLLRQFEVNQSTY